MSRSATVTIADILELRADGLSEEEMWSLLCQSVQTLQDLFLSGIISDGEVFPIITPNTLEVTRRGTVVISSIRRALDHHEPYLAPEYTNQRPYLTNLDWEKMWVYSLGKTLLLTLKTAAKAESLMVLRFMTAKDPSLRASLMSLLNIISEHCKTNQPMKPSCHLVMEMYKEVFGTPPQCLLPLDIPDSDGVVTEGAPSIDAYSEPLYHSVNMRKNTLSMTSSPNGSLGSNPPLKRNPVQRAPSRLYRGPSSSVGDTQNGRRNTCVGPEFVVRGMEPPKVIHVGDVKASQRKCVTVILLTGQKVKVTCDPHSITCGKVFEILVQVENIEDNYIFGLASTINGDFVFVPSEMKLHKVAPPGWKDGGGKESNPPGFFLYFRVKFFLPSWWRLRNNKTKHLMYLQLRRSLLEQQIKCGLEEFLTLGGLALQSDFGNYDENEHGESPYFLLEHYIPEELIDERLELEDQLQQQHKSRSGLDPTLAEEIFVAQVQRLPEYGSHHFTALWVRKSVSIPMWVTVNPQGVYLYEKKKNVLDRKIHEAFVWKNIQGLSCNENYFRLAPQDVFGQKVPSYKLRMDNKKSFFLFRLASFHHQFFLKLRIELSPVHALSQEFGIVLKKDNKYILEETRPVKQEKKKSASHQNLEERQNKENENPLENRREKRTGVKMGVSAFQSSGTVDGSQSAYVIALKSYEDANFTYDLHESIQSKLWNDVSWEEERVLRKVHLMKDKYGSFGLEIVEGTNGGLFVENVLKRKGEDEIDAVQKGDQLLSVNGICLLNLNYSDALNVLKTTGSEIEILISQSCRRESRKNPLEHEYLKNIRYETANEIESAESELSLKTALR